MKKSICTFVTAAFAALAGNVFAQAPVVGSFSPAGAPPGTSVTISGSNFNTVAGNNAVYFGPVKAAITSASATQLVVTVPKSAGFAPVTVVNTVTKLQGTTGKSFKPTFGPFNITSPAQYDPPVRPTYLHTPRMVNAVDVDNDGKVDLVMFKSGGTNNPGSFYVYPNITPTGSKTVVYGEPVRILPDPVIADPAAEIFDMNADGKLDFVVNGNNGVLILLNNSTPGNIISTAFTVALTVPTYGPIAVGDIDGDGRPDLVTSHNYYRDWYSFDYSELHIFRNTSTNNTVSFATYQSVFPSGITGEVKIADIDGDNKPELAVTDNGGVSVWRNKATPGVINAGSFEQLVRINAGWAIDKITFIDINDDGKPDILGYKSISYDDWGEVLSPSEAVILRNVSVPGSIVPSSFTSPVHLMTSINNLKTGDVNGDGKPDLIFTENRKITIRINQTTAGAFDSGSFGPSIPLTSFDDQLFSTNDLNGDGMADIVSLGYLNSNLTLNIYVGSPEINAPTITSVSPLSGPVGTTVTITGTNFTSGPGVATVYFGAVKAEVLTSTSTQLTVKAPLGATNQPISVTNNAKNRTAYWQKPFTIRYPIVTPGLAGNNTFAVPKNPEGLAVEDIDGDGRPEMITSNAGANGISIFRNISKPGNVPATTRTDISTANTPSSVTVGDIDGNGKKDIIITNQNSNTVSVFGNIATKGSISTASFINRVDFAVGNQPVAAAVGDLDGDGRTDVVVANYGSNTLSILRNTSVFVDVINADCFAPATTITGINTPNGVSIADVDGDGKPDITVTSFGTNKVLVLRNTTTAGTVSFAAAVNFSTGTGPSAVVVSDIDGDGKADISVANKTANTISVLRNQSATGSIAFAGKVDLATGQQPQALAIGDMNGDGKPDLLSANFTSNSVTAYGNGTTSGNITGGSFLRYTVPVGTNPQGVVIADMDLDGKSDLVVANGGSSNVYVFRNDPVMPKVKINDISPVRASLGETVTITGDNFSYDNNTNVVYFGATRATVVKSTPTELSVTVPAGATYEPVSVLSTKSKSTAYSAKVFVPSFIKQSKEFYDNDLLMTFEKSSNKNPRHIKIADIDGDGKPDLVVTSQYSEVVEVYRNTSANGAINGNSFGQAVEFITAAMPAGVHVTDLNSDGKPDLVVTNRISSYISIFQNISTPGTVKFATKVDFGTGTTPSPAITADINGDGKPEIIVANTGNNNISVYPNLIASGNITTASFGARINVGVGTAPSTLSAGELDGDGKTDIVVGNSGSGVLSVLKNISSGSITAASFVKLDVNLGNGNITDVMIGDIDGDGVNDITAINNGIAVLRNAGINGTGAPVNLTAGDKPTSLTIADMDGDGKPEILVTSSGTNGQLLSVFRNAAVSGSLNASSFDERVNFDTNIASGTVTAGDLDADGKTDVILAAANRFYFFKNKPFYFAPSVISFSPLKGPAGTVVTITGNNFHKKAAKNAVYFGGVKAIPTSGTTTSLSVVVPHGTTYEPLTLINTGNGRSGMSAKKYLQTYSPSKPTIERNDFEPWVRLSTSGYRGDPHLIDFDNDGKLDVVSHSTQSDYSLYVQRNISVSGSITAASFAAPVLAQGTLWGPLTFADLDGDNKIDIICLTRWSLSIIKNTSTPGNISFAPEVAIKLFGAGYEAGRPSVGDIDGDGRPDIIGSVCNSDYSANFRVMLFKNVCDKGSITANSILPPVFINSPNKLLDAKLADIDGDGKADIVGSLKIGFTNTTKVAVFRNIANMGVVNSTSFAPMQTFDAAETNGHGQVNVADIDGDGKLDVLSSIKSALRNQSTPGNISLMPAVATGIPSPYGNDKVTFSDINGDGKPDIVMAIYVFMNTSTTGNLKFDVANQAVISTPSFGFNDAGDVDGDGKPDLVSAGPCIHRANPQIAAFATTTVAAEPAVKDLSINSALSPNGDGTNDVFTINGVEKYPDNKLIIVNTTGAKVYEAVGYNNTSKAFNGVSSAGERQKPGSYFYTFEYNDGGVKKSKTGYLVLKY